MFANGYCLSLFLTDMACCITVEAGGSLNAVYYFFEFTWKSCFVPRKGVCCGLDDWLLHMGYKLYKWQFVYEFNFQ